MTWIPSVDRRYQPCRGSDVELWLRRTRDKYPVTSPGWFVLDDLLEDYRLCADTGDSLVSEREGLEDRL